MDPDPERARLDAALTQASDEVGLQDYYRDCVRPLLRMPETQWPSCCGRGCEPCADTLCAVAERVKELLARSEEGKMQQEDGKDASSEKG